LWKLPKIASGRLAIRKLSINGVLGSQAVPSGSSPIRKTTQLVGQKSPSARRLIVLWSCPLLSRLQENHSTRSKRRRRCGTRYPSRAPPTQCAPACWRQRRPPCCAPPYGALVLWDLGHQTPDSDERFLLSLRDRAADAIHPLNEDYAAHLRSAKEKPYQDICEVFDAFRQEGIKVLMLWDGFDKPLGSGRLTRNLWDGFDKPLGSGRLTRNLWDQLKDLATLPNVRLVTASRKRLHELIRSAETQTSDLWEIFYPNPIWLEPFDDEDVDSAILAPLRAPGL
jgi:hypothetical protein